MELQPRRQPGRADRKAAVYASEIARLRSAGYTYEAIREALADVGIQLSTSAVQREVRRMQQRPARVPSMPQPGPPTATGRPGTTAQPAAVASAPRLAASPHFSGHDIAEAFFTAHPSNPLLQNKETP